jgi:hypothetical protein
MTMTDSTDSLTERIRKRVDTARQAVELRAKATRPRAGSRLVPPTDSNGSNPEEERAAQSLKRVFRDLGLTYRRHRSQVGGAVTPGLRDAAYKFREQPTFASLVVVAGFLDELKLLD